MVIETALKEWSVAVDALAAGETILLLRKGGIKEHQGRFSPEADRVALFPTFEHQRPDLLKPQYRETVAAVPKGWHPEKITIKAWADITHIFLTDNADKVAALANFHIWQPQLAQERLNWKPKQPLYVMALRTYRLSDPVVLPWQAAYSGCRSWIALNLETDATDVSPVVADANYHITVEAIEAVLLS